MRHLLTSLLACLAVAAQAQTLTAVKVGWKLDKKSVNKKTGAFMCNAKVGTPLPATKLSCSGESGYFENAKRAQIGCRP